MTDETDNLIFGCRRPLDGKRGEVAGKTREPRLGAAVREWQVAARKQCFDRPDQRVAHIEKRLEPVEG